MTALARSLRIEGVAGVGRSLGAGVIEDGLGDERALFGSREAIADLPKGLFDALDETAGQFVAEALLEHCSVPDEDDAQTTLGGGSA